MESFALSGDGQVVLQGGRDFSAPATSLDGAGATGGPQIGGVRQVNNLAAVGANALKSIMALDKLTDGGMRGYIEKVEKTQYHDGMTKVVQGQTLEQIKEADPWYMNIMGPSATVRGAQAMTATTAIQQAETRMLESMQADRELSPDQYRAKLRDQYMALGNTGDPMVDMMAQSKFAESNASLARTHTQQHMLYQQEQSFANYTNMNVSLGDNLRAKRGAVGSTGMTGEEAAQMQAEAVEAFMPLPGMSRDSWNKAAVATLTTALQKGNFDHYNTIRSSPAWSRIDLKAREALEAHYDNAVLSDAQRNPAVTDITNSIANFEFNSSRGQTGITSEAGFHKYVDHYNERHSATTGAGEPLINNTRRAALLKQWHAGRQRLADKLEASQRATADKEAQYRDTGAVVMDSFVTGNHTALQGLTLDPKAVRDALDKNFHQEYGDVSDPARQQRFMERAAQASFSDKLVIPAMKGILQVGVTGLLNGGGTVTPTQKEAYVMAQRLYSTTNGPEALTNYLGAADAAKVAGLINSGVSMDDPRAMQDQLLRMQKGGQAQATEAEKKEVLATVQRADPGFFRALLPWGDRSLADFNLDDASKQRLGEMVAGKAAQYQRAYGVSVEQATRITMAEAVRNSDVIGGTVIPRLRNSSTDVSLASAVNRIAPGAGQQHTESYQTAAMNVINGRLTEAVRARGGDMANFDPAEYRIANGVQLGNGALQVFLLAKDPGKQATVGIVPVTLQPKALADEIKRIESGKATRQDVDFDQRRREGGSFGLGINADALNLRPAVLR